MDKYTVFATLTKEYEVEVKANNPAQAIEKLDDWIADDFEPFQVNGKWELEAR